MKRLFDILVSILFLLILGPLLLFIAGWIRLDSNGPVFYRQERTGRYGRMFRIYKFRTMYPDSDRKGLLTVGGRDPRITRAGLILRRYKLDELPQFLNVLYGEMSIVGPRPEVKKYTDMYTEDQRQVLNVRPGITDYASLEYIDENELLARSSDPEAVYIREIMPAKLALNMKYIREVSFLTDIRIILKTAKRMFFRN